MKKTLNKIMTISSGLFDQLFPIKVIGLETLSNHLKIYRGNSNPSQISLFSYKDSVIKDAIWQVKYRNNKKQAKMFSVFLSDFLLEEINVIEKLHNFRNPIIVKIPSSSSSIRMRGYDHNELFLTKVKKIVKVENILIKKVDTPRQSRFKSKKERRENVRNTFLVSSPESINNRNIIIFDDVTTSGATLTEAKRIIEMCGPKRIMFLTLAR